MPGRLAIYNDIDFKKDLSLYIKNDMIQNLHPRYNIAPSIPIPALLNNGNYLYTHFGYLPSWAKSKSSMNINARSESIFEKVTFRDSFKYRRCIIPINGFYEWKKEDKLKTPYYVSNKKKSYLALAGIWDEWFDKDLGMNIVTVALVTCDANDKLSKIHPRMPVVLDEKDLQKWLNPKSLSEANSVFKIYKSEDINIYEVSSDVNKVLYDKSSCIEKVSIKNTQLTLF